MTRIDHNSKYLNFYSSPLGKKIITGLTGLGLTLFVVFHVTANLLLLTSAKAYNQFAHVLNSTGILLGLIELILLGLIIFHVAIAISIQINKRQARPIGYKKYTTVGQPSKQSLSSRTMMVTGLVIFIFLIFHLLNFKFGTYYSTVVNGVPMRDLARLVIEKFQQPFYAFSYVGVMVFLGFHLRHGVWSAFQSLGMIDSRWSSFVYTVALVLALAIALGFIVLPLAIYFGLVG